LPRMVDRCAALALPKGAALPGDWPLPQLVVPAEEVRQWRGGVGGWGARPGAGGGAGGGRPPERGGGDSQPVPPPPPPRQFLAARGNWVGGIGGPMEKDLAAQIVAAAPSRCRDLTGSDLRNAILATAAADVVISNDSGLLHVAAAIGTPSIGIFGPTSPWHWAPLNPLAAVIETKSDMPCRPCHKPTCRLPHHPCMPDTPMEPVAAAVPGALRQTAM